MGSCGQYLYLLSSGSNRGKDNISLPLNCEAKHHNINSNKADSDYKQDLC